MPHELHLIIYFSLSNVLCIVIESTNISSDKAFSVGPFLLFGHRLLQLFCCCDNLLNRMLHYITAGPDIFGFY